MKTPALLRAVFWIALVAFIGWDFVASPRIDLRFEPPLVAAGSGQQSSGGHCALPK